jgi:predicted nucleotide-binding protein (sugar kinase/HSP70/actin superfamily)
LELLSGKSVGSTDYPELMGAFGAALYARNKWQEEGDVPGFAGQKDLPDMETVETRELYCKGCTNKCPVLRFTFKNGNICYAGNKCEKVFYNKHSALPVEKGYNAFEWKNSVLFDRSRRVERIAGKTIGIPRVLNMFENYPFWHTLFTHCGFAVVLSPESTFPLYQRGVGSVMSDNICFPAKLVHGHLLALIDEKPDRIFYPMITKEEKEFRQSSNSFNCPVVSGYPDVIRSSVDPEEKYNIPLDKPVINFTNEHVLKEACFSYLNGLGVSKELFEEAFTRALEEKSAVREQLREEQKERLDRAILNNEWAFVVAGRPYHADPLVHQKIGQTLSDFGIHAFTDDVFRMPESEGFGTLKIVSQWSYPNRVVQSAMEVAKMPQHIQLIQLNSFGCGPDSFFMDETGDILKHAGKNHTVLRIDEISGSGSVRLRLRSLIESLKSLPPVKQPAADKPYAGYTVNYTKADKKKTILIPWFADFISPFIPIIAELAGYKMVNLPKTSKASADTGLKYGNNEVCYPSTLIVGDIITGLQSGEYDLNECVVAITQTGGQCRATNYLGQIKSALQNAGFGHIPVVIISMGEVFQNEQKAFELPLVKFADVLVYTLLYADALQKMYSSSVVREKTKGEARKLFDFYIERGIEALRKKSSRMVLELMKQAVADFNLLPVYERSYAKTGLIGEIFVKYNSYGQAHITEWLRDKGMEVTTPPILDFLMQYFVNSEVNIKNKVTPDSFVSHLLRPVFLRFMNKRIRVSDNLMKCYRFYEPVESIFAKARYASEILDLANQFGEGWMIAAEVAAYTRNGVHSVVCVQPFGCIANHIVAKGIEKRLKKFYPGMTLLYLDIDGGMAEVNLQNRLLLL